MELCGPSLGAIIAGVFGRVENVVVEAKGYKHGLRVRVEWLKGLSHREVRAIKLRLDAVPREHLTQMAQDMLSRLDRLVGAALSRLSMKDKVTELVTRVFGSPKRILRRSTGRRRALEVRREYFRGMDYAAMFDIDTKLSDMPRMHLGPRERALLLKLDSVVMEELLKRLV